MSTAARPEIELELKQQVATAHGILGRLGLADYMGHASARVPGTEIARLSGPMVGTDVRWACYASLLEV